MRVRTPKSLAPRTSGAIDVLEYEVLQEKAATLGRLTETFEKALAAFVASDEAVRRGDATASALARREQRLDAAGAALWYFVIQRELCGLRNTEAVLREYRVPAVVRLRMGVSRRAEPVAR